MQGRKNKQNPKAYLDGTHTDTNTPHHLLQHFSACTITMVSKTIQKFFTLFYRTSFYTGGGEKKEKTKQEGSNNHDEKQTMKKEQDNGCDAEKSSKTVNLPLWCPHLFTSVVQPLIVYSRCLSANCEYPFKNCQDATQSKCYPSCNSSWSTALTNWK